ncbi:XRE family transcriptional regulator [Emticicia soli]|uniref:XRE family transcriptional regulator n=1 Tax=Emticicia soli TaxID=2027878 RepID=A0ABW5J6J1_9BACT
MKPLEKIIKQRLAELGMQVKDLVPLIGVSDQSVLSRIFKRNSTSYETLVKISNALQIPIEELTGEVMPVSNVKVVSDYELVELPYIPIDARATFISSIVENMPIVLEKFQVLVTDKKENLKDNLVFEVDGDSMEPKLWSKMKVRVKPVPHNDWEFIPSGIYLVLYRNEYLVIKRIKSNQMQTTGTITLHSDNEETGGSLTLQKKDINNIWRVLRIVDAPLG